MARRLPKRYRISEKSINSLKKTIKEQLKKERYKDYITTEKKIATLQEQAQQGLFMIAVGGKCMKCPPGQSMHVCPYSDSSCTKNIRNEMDVATGNKKEVVVVGTESPKINESKNVKSLKLVIEEALRKLKEDKESYKMFKEAHCYGEDGRPIPEAHCSEMYLNPKHKSGEGSMKQTATRFVNQNK